MRIKNSIDLIEYCKKHEIDISEAMVRYETANSDKSRDQVIEYINRCLIVMREAVHKGLHDDINELRGHMITGDSRKIKEKIDKKETLCGDTVAKAMCYALSNMEVNASMGRVVAAPTAGSCGVIPGVFLSLEENHKVTNEQLVKGLLTASSIGLIIAKNATLAGAEGGCQAEVGSASAMAAGATVDIFGGTIEQVFDAAAIALKNVMGLICDPVAGLVEAPCQKRNAMGASNALISAEMVLAGIKSVIPFDEVVWAVRKVGKEMPNNVRETSDGGIAITCTGRCIRNNVFGK